MYEEFAEVYDTFMEDVPYDAWALSITDTLRTHGVAEGALVLDLACGTGQMTRRLARAGYDMIGVDASPEMLAVAGRASDEGILYLCQDMRSFELYGTVAAIVCVCDSLNYLLTDAAIDRTFALAANYLDPGGLLMFDIKTRYVYEELLADRVFAENADRGSYIWENSFDVDTAINEYDLTLFLRQEDGRYARYAETHTQRAYEAEEITALLEKNGFGVLSVTDAQTGGAVQNDTERIFFTAQVNK
ncbi:MAG: class I SAM-dependent methyltransferase [Lachnospiraceae bacterium]|nr:class I SAM-dependent methyltransferase [Lachnospiraceae bacterium]